MEDLLLSQFTNTDLLIEKDDMDLYALVDLKPPSTPPPPPSEGPLFTATTTNRSTDSTTGSNPEQDAALLNQSLVSFLANSLPASSTWKPTTPPIEDFGPTYEDEQLQSLLGMLTLHEPTDVDRRDRAISFPVNALMPSTPIAASPAWSNNRQCQSMDRANVRRQLLADAKRAPIKGWWKTELCKFWREGSGCRNGSSCRWAHGDDELRRVTPPPLDLEKPTERKRHASYQFTPRTQDLVASDPQQLPRPRPPPQLPRHSLSPGDIRGPQELGWAQLPLEQLPMDRRIDAVDHVWNVIRVRHATSLRLPENVIIAGMPGLQVNQKYWRDVLCALDAPLPALESRLDSRSIALDSLILTNQCTGTNTTATTASSAAPFTDEEADFSTLRKAVSANEHDDTGCQLCGKRIAAAGEQPRILSIGRGRLPLQCCDSCLQIAEEKAIAVHLPLEYNAQDDRRKLLSWGLKLTQFIRTCDEGVWRARDSRADIFDLPRQMKSLWDLHIQQLCRLSAVLHLYLESLPAAGRAALFLSEVLPGVSLVEWMAVANQPMLFLVFLLIGLPLPHLSLPSTVLPVCIHLPQQPRVTRQSADLTDDGFLFNDWSPKKHVRSGSAAVHRLPPLRAFR